MIQIIKSRLCIVLLLLICIPILVVILIWGILAAIVGSTRGWNTIVAIDRCGNTVTGGIETETISSRAYRGTLEKNKGWCILCKFLDYIQKDHCKNNSGV